MSTRQKHSPKQKRAHHEQAHSYRTHQHRTRGRQPLWRQRSERPGRRHRHDRHGHRTACRCRQRRRRDAARSGDRGDRGHAAIVEIVAIAEIAAIAAIAAIALRQLLTCSASTPRSCGRLSSRARPLRSSPRRTALTSRRSSTPRFRPKTERLNAAVEAGRLTAAEADEKLAGLQAQVTTRVNEGGPDRGADGERPARGERGRASGPRWCTRS